MSRTETSAPSPRAVQAVRDAAPYLESWLEVQRSRARVPAVQAAVRVGGELVLSVALGTSDAARARPLTTDDRFRVASHSKTFTAALALQLVESGALRLDDPLERWVPRIRESAPALGPVTVRALLGHQGGVVRDGRDADHWQHVRPFPGDLTGVLGLAEDGAVLGTDERFKYSNVAYALLGAVVEAAGGAPWADQLRERVTGPLGLAATLADLGPDDVGADGLAVGHAVGWSGLLDGDDERLPVPATPTGAMAPATGVSSTAEDLTAWVGAHAEGSTAVLGAPALRLALREESRVAPHGEVALRWGLGLEIGEVGGRRVVGHSGGFPGYITRTWCDPVSGVAVSVLTACSDGPADPMARGVLRLVDLVLGGPDGQGGQRGEGGTTGGGEAGGQDLSRFAGSFAGLFGRTDVALLGGRLVLVGPARPDPGEGHLLLEPDGADALRVEAVDGTGPVGERVEYAWADDGSVASVRLGGMTCWPVEDFRARRAAMLSR